MTRDEELTVESHRIQDVFHTCFEGKYSSASECVVNIGFASTTLYHGPQPNETPSTWQEAIIFIMKSWKGGKRLFIRSGNTEVLGNAISEEFVTLIRNVMGFDVFYNKDVEFIKM